MKKPELLLTIIFGLITLISWFFPDIDLAYKVLITSLLVLSILYLVFKEKLSYFFKKHWIEIIAALLLISSLIIIWKAFPNLLLPSIIIILTSISICLLLYLKLTQTKVFRHRTIIRTIPLDTSWQLNHWGSSCASINANKMIFKGTAAPQGSDGSHIDFSGLLEVGSSYLIKCHAKSVPGTTGKMQLWCHDNLGSSVHGSDRATEFKTPSTKGDDIQLIFNPLFNNDIRIHLQYYPGNGTIEISDVVIYCIK
jgi:hypothetical protein